MEIREWFDDMEWKIRDLFEHYCRYKLAQMGFYEGEEHREHPSGIPLVAWRLECRCGREKVNYTSSGIRLLQKGLSEDQVVTRWI